MSNILKFERLPTIVNVRKLRIYPKPGKVKALAAEMARRGWKLEEMETRPPALIYVR